MLFNEFILASIFASILAAIALIFFQAFLTGAPPVSTSPQARSVLLDVIAPGPGGVIYELGSGWGGLARSLARRGQGDGLDCIKGHGF